MAWFKGLVALFTGPCCMDYGAVCCGFRVYVARFTVEPFVSRVCVDGLLLWIQL